MIDKLIRLITEQNRLLLNLSELLDTQYNMIINNDVFGLEGIVEKLKSCSKEIAEVEFERRNLIGSDNVTTIVKNANNLLLNKAYDEIRTTLKDVKFKKDTNNLFIKQQLILTNKMISAMKPNSGTNTYNSMGNLSR